MLLIWLTEPRRQPIPAGFVGRPQHFCELAQGVSLRVVELSSPLRVTALRELTHAPRTGEVYAWGAHPQGSALAWRKGPGAVTLMNTQTLEDYAHIDMTTHPSWKSTSQHCSLENCLWSPDGRFLVLQAKYELGDVPLLTIHCAESGQCLRTVDVRPGDFVSKEQDRQVATPFCWAHHSPMFAVWGMNKDQLHHHSLPDTQTWPPTPSYQVVYPLAPFNWHLVLAHCRM